MTIELERTTVSIIMPTYNSLRFVEASIDSVLAQTFKDWELLITDDCSTDGTKKIVEKYCLHDSRIKAHFLSVNSGAAVCRNTSIEDATGEYIAFLDSDDCWRKEKLEIQLEFMKRENVDLVFSSYNIIDEAGDGSNRIVDTDVPARLSYHQLLGKQATIGCLTVMFKADKFSDISMPNIRTGQDYALWLKLLRQTKYAYKVPGVLADYRIVAGSISRNKFRKAVQQWRIYRDVEYLSLISSFKYFFSYAWRAIFRR